MRPFDFPSPPQREAEREQDDAGYPWWLELIVAATLMTSLLLLVNTLF